MLVAQHVVKCCLADFVRKCGVVVTTFFNPSKSILALIAIAIAVFRKTKIGLMIVDELQWGLFSTLADMALLLFPTNVHR